MLEKMLEIAKENAIEGQIIVRIDMQLNYKSYLWSTRVWYSGDRVIDINQTAEGFEVYSIIK